MIFVFRLLNKKIIFRGQLDSQLMPSVYSTAQMTIVPSLYEEGTALAALESMSCGTATVSTNVSGLADLPTKQCDPNERDFSELMIECFQNRGQIANEQIEVVHKIYNLDNFKKAWLEVINSI